MINEILYFRLSLFHESMNVRTDQFNLKIVQKYLGHATLQMTMDLYTSVMPKYLTDEMEKVSVLLDKISNDGEAIAEKQYESVANNTNIVPFDGDIKVV